MAAFLALLFLAVAVKQDQTPLRSSCGADSELVATLPAGADVTIRFALSAGGGPCYKVAVTLGGKEASGYVPASALEGLDEFEHGLREAQPLQTNQVMQAVLPSAGAAVGGAGKRSGVVNTAANLIDSGQPEKALALIEPEVRGGKDPVLLAVAGAAAWRADNSAKALGYWRESLDLQPNPALEDLYKRVEKENKNDKGSARLIGMRVALRYEEGAVGVDTARAMLAALDQEFARVSAELGCAAGERIQAIAQSPDAYRKSTDAAEWSGGQYDGRIRVPVAQGATVDAGLHRVLAHEITHACLAMTGRWPAWLQEGLAQRLSGDQVPPELHARLAEWAKDHKLPTLENLGQDWSRLDRDHAVAAYALSLAAVDLFYESAGADGVRNLLHNPERLSGVVADLDKRLGL